MTGATRGRPARGRVCGMRPLKASSSVRRRFSDENQAAVCICNMDFGHTILSVE
jgi:hypothetical protein